MKFQVGDRVRVYTSDISPDYMVFTAWVWGIQSNGLLDICKEHPPGSERWGRSFRNAHPKQCRRLKKREPRRRVWIHKTELGYVRGNFVGTKPEQTPINDWVEFIEVRRK